MAYRTQWKLDAEEVTGKKCSKLQVKEIEEHIEENDDMRWVFGEGLFEWGEEDRSFRTKMKTCMKYPSVFQM